MIIDFFHSITLVAMGRSKSTPGLVESKGKVPVSNQEIQLKENSASTATLLKADVEDEEKIIADHNEERPQESIRGNEVIESTSSIDTMKASSRDSHQCPQSSCDSNNKANSNQPYSMLTPNRPLIYSHLLSPNVALVNFDNRSQHGTPNIYSTSQLSPAPFFPTSHFSPSPYHTISPATSTNQLPTFPNAAATSVNNLTFDENSFSNNIQIEFPTHDALLSEIKRLRERVLTLETENASMSMKLNQQQWQVESRYIKFQILFKSN